MVLMVGLLVIAPGGGFSFPFHHQHPPLGMPGTRADRPHSEGRKSLLGQRRWSSTPGRSEVRAARDPRDPGLEPRPSTGVFPEARPHRRGPSFLISSGDEWNREG